MPNEEPENGQYGWGASVLLGEVTSNKDSVKPASILALRVSCTPGRVMKISMGSFTKPLAHGNSTLPAAIYTELRGREVYTFNGETGAEIEKTLNQIGRLEYEALKTVVGAGGEVMDFASHIEIITQYDSKIRVLIPATRPIRLIEGNISLC
jgi:hypothetical protein